MKHLLALLILASPAYALNGGNPKPQPEPEPPAVEQPAPEPPQEAPQEREEPREEPRWTCTHENPSAQDRARCQGKRRAFTPITDQTYTPRKGSK